MTMKREFSEVIKKEVVDNAAQSYFAYLAAHSEELVVIEHRDRIKLFGAFVNEVWAQIQEDIEIETRGG